MRTDHQLEILSLSLIWSRFFHGISARVRVKEGAREMGVRAVTALGTEAVADLWPLEN